MSDRLLTINADVVQGYNPVIEAVVIATVTRGDDAVMITLKDDGIGKLDEDRRVE